MCLFLIANVMALLMAWGTLIIFRAMLPFSPNPLGSIRKDVQMAAFVMTTEGQHQLALATEGIGFFVFGIGWVGFALLLMNMFLQPYGPTLMRSINGVEILFIGLIFFGPILVRIRVLNAMCRKN